MPWTMKRGQEQKTFFSTGDGATTFRVPDLRGMFLRGYDNAMQVDKDAESRVGGNVVGSYQADEFKKHNHGGGIGVYNLEHQVTYGQGGGHLHNKNGIEENGRDGNPPEKRRGPLAFQGVAMIQINDFSAGANNYIDRAKLGEKVAVMMRDCIPETGSLESGYNDLPVPAESPVDLGHWGDSDRSVAKQFGRTYWSNNLAQSAPYYGGDHYALGVPYPDFPPELSTTDDEGSERKGRYRYCMTYVRDGYESAPGPVGDGYFASIELAEGKAVRYLAGAPPEGITAVNVYRTIAEGAEFYLLESLTPEEAAALAHRQAGGQRPSDAQCA